MIEGRSFAIAEYGDIAAVNVGLLGGDPGASGVSTPPYAVGGERPPDPPKVIPAQRVSAREGNHRGAGRLVEADGAPGLNVHQEASVV